MIERYWPLIAAYALWWLAVGLRLEPFRLLLKRLPRLVEYAILSIWLIPFAAWVLLLARFVISLVKTGSIFSPG